MKTLPAPSIYNDSAREYLKWARQQPDRVLIEQIKTRIGETFQMQYFKSGKIEYAINDAWLVKRINLVNKILKIRDTVRKIVSNCCATANGLPYTGTTGWWIVPMVTENNTVGLVNISKGVALDTGIKLSRAQIKEMTVRASVLLSGNMAAEAHNASFPEGWIQILADSRGGEAKPVSEYMPKAKIVKRGLITCYKTMGDENSNFEWVCGWPREYNSPFCDGSEKKLP